jgi:hypothetical protein
LGLDSGLGLGWGVIRQGLGVRVRIRVRG